MKILRLASAALFPLLLALGGCAAQPAPFPHEAADGLKPGPGLLSGERGLFVIFEQASDAASDTSENEERNGDSAGEE